MSHEGRSVKTLGANLRVGSVIGAYLLLNSSLNLLMKWALGNFFPFPLLVTTFHMMFSFVVLLPYMLSQQYIPLHSATLRRQWKGLVCIGVFMATNIALNNLSLVLISLSLNQVIRSAIPVATAMLAVGIEGKRPTRGEFLSLLVLTAGVMVAVWEGLRGSVLGIVFACAGMLSNAAMMSTSGRVLSEKLEAVRLTFYTAPISCLTLLPFFFWREAALFRQFMVTDWRTGIAVLLVTSCNALAYNIIHNTMIKMTSAVTTTVIGEGKIVGLLILSALLLGESKQYTLRMMAGCGLAMAGFVSFSHCKLVAAQAKAAQLQGKPGKHADDAPVNGSDAPDSPEKRGLLSDERLQDMNGVSQGALSPHRRSSNNVG